MGRWDGRKKNGIMLCMTIVLCFLLPALKMRFVLLTAAISTSKEDFCRLYVNYQEKEERDPHVTRQRFPTFLSGLGNCQLNLGKVP